MLDASLDTLTPTHQGRQPDVSRGPERIVSSFRERLVVERNRGLRGPDRGQTYENVRPLVAGHSRCAGPIEQGACSIVVARSGMHLGRDEGTAQNVIPARGRCESQ